MRTILPITAAVFVFACAAHGDIYQWEYINPAAPGQGKRQSTTLAPDGSGVDAVPGANLYARDLTMAYLIGADLTAADSRSSNLTNADLSHSKLANARFAGANLSGADVSKAQLANSSFTQISCGDTLCVPAGATLISVDFANSNLRNVDFTAPLYGWRPIMTLIPKELQSDAVALVAIAKAAHLAGDRDLLRIARRELADQHGIILRFLRAQRKEIGDEWQLE